jgi:hypothetical protein
MTTGPEILAFYLPQFHPVPENDVAWGRGFVEWANVVRARPIYEGHYQPHMPGELGFYDLRIPEVRQSQAALARSHGITGFCYYHYWFCGRRPLARPFDEVLRSGVPDFPFCLAWANENWTTRWDAGNNDVFVRQDYSDEDHENHVDFLIRAWSDPRYIRLDGRPIFFIYRAYRIPGLPEVLRMWRERAVAAGVGSPYFIKFDTGGTDNQGPYDLGCDAAAEFLPHGVFQLAQQRPNPNQGKFTAFDYEEVVDIYSDRESPGWVRFPCVLTSWDNTPRQMNGEPFLLTGANPDSYERWLEAALRRAASQGPDGGIVLINAWNEWAEGAHLEPDERDGRAYLDATARAVAKFGDLAVTGAPVAAELPTSPAQLYLDLYERYVDLQRVHAGVVAAQEREAVELESLRNDLAVQARKEVEELAQEAKILREELENVRTALSIERAKNL